MWGKANQEITAAAPQECRALGTDRDTQPRARPVGFWLCPVKSGLWGAVSVCPGAGEVPQDKDRPSLSASPLAVLSSYLFNEQTDVNRQQEEVTVNCTDLSPNPRLSPQGSSGKYPAFHFTHKPERRRDQSDARNPWD